MIDPFPQAGIESQANKCVIVSSNDKTSDGSQKKKSLDIFPIRMIEIYIFFFNRIESRYFKSIRITVRLLREKKLLSHLLENRRPTDWSGFIIIKMYR